MELRDLYDENSVLTDKTYYKGEKIPEGYYPMVVMVAIQNSEGKFLMQKRVPEKGGIWGVTGGHPKSGRTPIEGAYDEVNEELGIDISNDDLVVFAEGCDGEDCYKMYYLKKDIDLNNIVIQEDELTDVAWFTMDELYQMVINNELDDNQMAFIEKCRDYLNNIQ